MGSKNMYFIEVIPEKKSEQCNVGLADKNQIAYSITR